MADSILRLKVESQEYDDKLKRAAEGIQRLASKIHDSQGEFVGIENEQKEFIKNLQYMNTVSQTATGKVKELETAYKGLQTMYNGFTAFEKNSEEGKILAEQLSILKEKTLQARKEMEDASESLSNTGGFLDQLTSKFTVNIDALKLFDIGMKAAGAALDVAKDAFFSSESNIDEWGRTVESTKGAYDIFLQTLNNGNWSNFFQNLNEAIRGSRDLYDSLDRLSSIKANNQAAIALVQAEIQQLRVLKDQGQDVDDKIKAATERLARLQQQAIDAGKKAGSDTVFNTIRNGVNGSNTTNVTVDDSQIQNSMNALIKNGQDAFEYYKRRASQLYEKGLVEVEKYDTLTKDYYTTREFSLSALSKEEQKHYLVAKAITERETTIQEGLNLYAQAVNESASSFQQQHKGYKYANQGSGRNGGKTDEENAQKQVADALLAYEQTIKKAQLEMESGLKTDADVKKATLQAQEKLWEAYGKAYATYADPKYKEAQDKAAEEIKKLGGEVKANADAQAAAKEAAKEQADAAKKLKDAQDKLAKAIDSASKAGASGNLKDFYNANKHVSGMGGQTLDISLFNFNATESNIDAFIAHLKEKLQNSELGSTTYNALTAQLADAQMLGSFIEYAVKNGIDIAQFAPQELWQKIFGENPGDYIPDDFWKGLGDEFSKALGKGLNIDTLSGSIGNKNQDNSFESFFKSLNKFGSGLNSVSSGLKQLGVDIPKEIDELINIINAVSSVIQGVQTIISIFGTSAVASNTVAVGLNTTAIAGLIAAMDFNSATNLIPFFAGGGVVGRAASGLLVGSNMSGDNLRMPVGGSCGDYIGINDGELILNKAQQSSLALSLEGGGLQNLELDTFISGEDIRIVLNNNGRRTGRGEYVQSRKG